MAHVCVGLCVSQAGVEGHQGILCADVGVVVYAPVGGAHLACWVEQALWGGVVQAAATVSHHVELENGQAMRVQQLPSADNSCQQHAGRQHRK